MAEKHGLLLLADEGFEGRHGVGGVHLFRLEASVDVCDLRWHVLRGLDRQVNANRATRQIPELAHEDFLVSSVPGPLTPGWTVGYLLWALGVVLIPLGVYYLLAVRRNRGRRVFTPGAAP